MIAFALIIFFSYTLILAWLACGIRRTQSAIPAGDSLPDVSVIIAARDEAQTLPACLQALASQTYAGKVQVLIVDDQSRDDTRRIAQDAANNHSRWQVLDNINTQRWRSGKKGALATALPHTTGEWLLFTDADCVPPPDWMAQMVRLFGPKTSVVAGYSPLQTPDASCLWQSFIRIDTLASALVAAGSIGHGHGITCTGRNLACRRKVLLKQNGYSQFPDSLSGDDDFLLQGLARVPGTGLAYAWHPHTAVPAYGPANWRDFIRQKTRHLSAGLHYSRSTQGLYLLAHSACAALPLFFFIGLMQTSTLALLFPAKIILDGMALGLLARRLQTPISLPGLLLWQVLFPLYHILAWLKGIVSGQSWKEIS